MFYENIDKSVVYWLESTFISRVSGLQIYSRFSAKLAS